MARAGTVLQKENTIQDMAARFSSIASIAS
jgi:hypothetical protein